MPSQQPILAQQKPEHVFYEQPGAEGNRSISNRFRFISCAPLGKYKAANQRDENCIWGSTCASFKIKKPKLTTVSFDNEFESAVMKLVNNGTPFLTLSYFRGTTCAKEVKLELSKPVVTSFLTFLRSVGQQGGEGYVWGGPWPLADKYTEFEVDRADAKNNLRFVYDLLNRPRHVSLP